MLQALVVTLREGVEAALIVAITIAYLQKIGRGELRKVVYWALGAAVVGSVIAAAALSRFDFNQEIFEGVIMLVAAFFVVTMIIFMARAARTLKKDIETRVGSFATTGSRVGLFLFVFLMVLREGVETVLILAAVSINTSDLLGFLATLTGLALAVAFGVMFVRGTVRIDLRKFFKVTTVILIFVAVQLVISGLHELSEGGVIPSTKQQMAIIGPIVRNDIFFFVTILALAALMVLFESRRRADAPAVADVTKADQRKALWTARRERLWSATVYASSFIFIMLVTAQFIYAKSTTSLSPATEVRFINGSTSIDIGGMKEGELRRYSALFNGIPVRFLLYKKPDGSVASIMDACAICGDVGFYNSGAAGITCKNCNAPVNPDSVGQGGGCNPIPLPTQMNGAAVIVSEAQLATVAITHAGH